MTGIILAGGKNSRMGRKKAFINVEGNTIIDRILTIFNEVFLEVIIVSNSSEDFSYTGLKVVSDIIPDKGSLGGLYTGLINMTYEKCFVVACDMPFISKSLIKYIIDIPTYDIVVPKIEGGYEPLFACYSRKCANMAKRHLDEGNLRISDLYAYFNVKEIHEDEIRKFDRSMSSLVNINTPEDLTSSMF